MHIYVYELYLLISKYILTTTKIWNISDNLTTQKLLNISPQWLVFFFFLYDEGIEKSVLFFFFLRSLFS